MILTEESKQDYTGVGMHITKHRRYVGDYKNGKEHGIGMYNSRYVDGTSLHNFAGSFNENISTGLGVKHYSYGDLRIGEYKKNQQNGLGLTSVGNEKTWGFQISNAIRGPLYIGEMKDHNPYGFGSMIIWSGLKFIGFVNGWCALNGKWYDEQDNPIDITELGYEANGRMYKKYKDNNTIIFPNGATYIGEINEKRKFHGFGTFIMFDGKYVGEYKNGKRNGRGMFIYPDGGIYVGEWKEQKKHGKGFYVCAADKCKYTGEWQNDQRHGYGKWIKDHMTYEGNFKESAFDGLGKIRYKTGFTYIGEFKNFKYHGQGILTHSDGTIQQGKFEKGQFIK